MSQATQVGAFRGQVDLVRLDVAVIDNRTGKTIRGLSADDFVVSENGVQQTISTFLDESRAEATDDARRVFLLVFGGGRASAGAPARPHEGAARFLRERLRPSDLAAIMAWNRVTEFTTDHQFLAAVVDRLRRAPQQLYDSLDHDSAKGLDISETSQKRIDDLFDPSGLQRSQIRSAAALLLGTTEYRQNDDIARRWNRMVAGNDLLKVTAGVEYLRSRAGDKHLVLLTQSGLGLSIPVSRETGLRVASDQEERALASRASDAGVAIDIILTTGSEVALAVPTPSGGTLRQGLPGVNTRQSLQNASILTGGQFASVRLASSQLERIDDATRNGYVLGYVPTGVGRDGNQREIVVGVKRRDVTVLHRRGYTARLDPPAVDPRQLLTDVRLAQAMATDLPLQDLPVKIAGANLSSQGENRVRVDLTIEPLRLGLTRNAGRLTGTVHVRAVYGDSRQTLLGKLDHQWLLTIDDGQDAALKPVAHLPLDIKVSGLATVRHVKVVVYDYASDRLGSASIVLR